MEEVESKILSEKLKVPSEIIIDVDSSRRGTCFFCWSRSQITQGISKTSGHFQRMHSDVALIEKAPSYHSMRSQRRGSSRRVSNGFDLRFDSSHREIFLLDSRCQVGTVLLNPGSPADSFDQLGKESQRNAPLRRVNHSSISL